MEAFFSRHRSLSILIAVLLAQVVLLGYQVRQNDARLLRVWAVTLSAPFQKALHAVSGSFRDFWRNYVDLRQARRDSQTLRAELDRLKLDYHQMRRTLLRFEREEELLAYQRSLPSRTLLAEVIGVGANPKAEAVFVNKGPAEGVKPGMAVITADGIVGKVQTTFATARASLVVLINDPDAAAGVILADSRVKGVMKGTGGGECRIDYVGHEVDVKMGEILYTSGEDRIYPKGLPVGQVTRLGAGAEFREIYAKPFAALDRLEEVLIVTVGVHQQLPDSYRPQAPKHVLPRPPPDPDLLSASRPAATPADETTGGAQAADPPTQADANNVAGEPSGPLTDADRLRRQYEAIGAAQGHTFGEGLPGSRPPDFNLGRLPSEGQEPPAARPPGRPGRGADSSRPLAPAPRGSDAPETTSEQPAAAAESARQGESVVTDEGPSQPPERTGREDSITDSEARSPTLRSSTEP